MARPSAKDSILDAAEAVVIEHGAGRLTLDAVAEKAGVSKGGLLYHFPAKEQLLEGMVRRLIARSTAQREEIFDSLPEGPSRELHADILLRLADWRSDDRVVSALLSVVAKDPKLFEIVRECHRERFSHYEGANFERKALLLLAADGLSVLELLRVSPFTPAQREALMKRLLELADSETESA